MLEVLVAHFYKPSWIIRTYLLGLTICPSTYFVFIMHIPLDPALTLTLWFGPVQFLNIANNRVLVAVVVSCFVRMSVFYYGGTNPGRSRHECVHTLSCTLPFPLWVQNVHQQNNQNFQSTFFQSLKCSIFFPFLQNLRMKRNVVVHSEYPLIWLYTPAICLAVDAPLFFNFKRAVIVIVRCILTDWRTATVCIVIVVVLIIAGGFFLR